MKKLPPARHITRHIKYRRKIHYVDETLQKLFLVGLVLLEALLAVGLAWLMWRHLNQIIDDNLYRVHLAEAVPILSQLAQGTLYLLGLFFAANLFALLLVDLIWRRYVNSILHLFMHLMRKTAALDFSADPGITKRHQILDLAVSQRDQDRQRLAEFRSRLSVLTTALPESDNTVSDSLQALHQLLPQAPTSTTIEHDNTQAARPAPH